MMQNIRDRLENWGRYQRGGSRVGCGGTMRAKETRSTSHGGGGWQCMTDVVCNIMRQSATGPAGWQETSRKMTSEEIADAKLVTSAYVRLPERQQSVLKWCYVLNAQPAVVCRKLGIPAWPASHFKRELFAAEDAIKNILENPLRMHEIRV